MQRFQRTAYLNRVMELRRELYGWADTYRGIANGTVLDGYNERQVAVAEAREDWCQELAEKLEEIEDMLAEPPEVEG